MLTAAKNKQIKACVVSTLVADFVRKLILGPAAVAAPFVLLGLLLLSASVYCIENKQDVRNFAGYLRMYNVRTFSG